MEEAGYTKFAADKATVQSLWRDLAGLDEFGNPKGTTDLAGIDLDDLLGAKEYTPLFICRDEMADFLGDANLEFVRNLGTMWDIDRPYDYRVKGAAPVVIPTPTINLLGGTTPSQYHKMFPPEMEGQGFLSRLIRVAVRETGRRIPDPPKMNPELRAQIVSVMERLQVLSGEAKLSPEANELRKQQYISIKNGKTKGFNTDTFGFEKTLLLHKKPHQKSAIVLGNGGAAKAVQFVLKKNNIPFITVSRTTEINYQNLTENQVLENHHHLQ
jgi:hypothetical protein